MSIPEFECCFPNCSARPTEHVRQPLCDRHLLSVYRDVRDRIVGANEIDQLVAMRQMIAERPSKTRFKQGVVYFVRFGNRIKIGFTTDLSTRMKVIPHDAILLTIPGNMSTEARLHRRFEHLRKVGEWFEMGDDLMEYIEATKRKQAAA